MAKYTVLEPSFISNRIVQVGEVVDVEFTDGGEAGPNLQAIDAPVKAKKAKAVPTLAIKITPADGADATDLT